MRASNEFKKFIMYTALLYLRIVIASLVIRVNAIVGFVFTTKVELQNEKIKMRFKMIYELQVDRRIKGK